MLKLLRPGISFVVPMTSLYRVALNQGSTVMNIGKRRVNKNDELAMNLCLLFITFRNFSVRF